MDPQANLLEQFELHRRIQGHIDDDVEPSDYEDDVQQLLILQIGLYRWLAKGGYPPTWSVFVKNADLRA